MIYTQRIADELGIDDIMITVSTEILKEQWQLKLEKMGLRIQKKLYENIISKDGVKVSSYL